MDCPTLAGKWYMHHVHENLLHENKRLPHTGWWMVCVSRSQKIIAQTQASHSRKFVSGVLCCVWLNMAKRQERLVRKESATKQEEHKKCPNKGRPGNYTCNSLKVTLMTLTGWLNVENMKESGVLGWPWKKEKLCFKVEEKDGRLQSLQKALIKALTSIFQLMTISSYRECDNSMEG